MVGREAGDWRGGCGREEAEEAPKGRGRSQVPRPGAEKAGFGARPWVWSQRPLHVQAVFLAAAGCVLSHPGQRACPAQEAGTGAGVRLLSPEETDKRRPGPLRLPQLWREFPRWLSLSPACREARRASSPRPSIRSEPCTCPIT